MNKNKKSTTIVVVIIIIILIGLFAYYYGDFSFSKNNNLGENSTSTSSNVKNVGGIVIDSKGGDFTVTELPPSSLPALKPVAQPDLDRKINFSKNLSAEVLSILNKNISDLSSELKKDSKNTDSWLALGIQYKIVGDYEAARDAFAYAGWIGQNLFVPFYNLGDLYNSSLKDYPKSEENYLRAIENNPQYIQSYVGLAELYRYSMNDKVSAKKYYTKALNEAVSQKNVSLEASLKAEIQSF